MATEKLRKSFAPNIRRAARIQMHKEIQQAKEEVLKRNKTPKDSELVPKKIKTAEQMSEEMVGKNS